MSLQIETTRTGRGTRVSITGVMDETADLASLDALNGPVEVSLRGLRRINSFGARAWMDAVRALAARVPVTFVEVSSAAIDQLNMIQGFLGNAPVKSFCAPLICTHCDHEETRVFQTRDCIEFGVTLPPTECPSCARDMQIDDVDEQYLLFLREPTQVA